MTYNMKNAAMSKGDADYVLRTHGDKSVGWDASQVARAKVVARHWARIRANQAARKVAA